MLKKKTCEHSSSLPQGVRLYIENFLLLTPHNAILGGKRSKIRFIMRRGRKAGEVEVRGEVEQSKGRLGTDCRER